MTILTPCPACGGSDFKPYLSCADFSVSKETFTIQQCEQCNLLLTNPQPLPEELHKYYQSEDYISHSDNGNSLINTLYLIARKFTLRWKYNILQKALSNNNPKNILDFGCGTGDFLLKCQTQGWAITGIEPSTHARSIAEKKLNTAIRAELNDQSNQTYSAITLWHVLEHLPDLNDTLARLRAQLRDDGTLFIAVPNPMSFDAQHYQSFWAAYDLPRHLWHFDRMSIDTILSLHQLRIEKVIPMKLDAFYVSLLSEKYKGGGITGLIRGALTGMRSNLKAKHTNEYSSLIYLAKKK